TPSAAAETAVPDAARLRADLAGRSLRLGTAARAGVTLKRAAAERLAGRLSRHSPGHRVAGLRQELDRRATQLRRALLHEVATKRHQLDLAAGGRRLQRTATGGIGARTAELKARQARLEALSPRRTLERGYSITLDPEGT